MKKKDGIIRLLAYVNNGNMGIYDYAITQYKRRQLELVELFKWILTDGQKECSTLGYARLPREVADKELELVNRFE